MFNLIHLQLILSLNLFCRAFFCSNLFPYDEKNGKRQRSDISKIDTSNNKILIIRYEFITQTNKQSWQIKPGAVVHNSAPVSLSLLLTTDASVSPNKWLRGKKTLLFIYQKLKGKKSGRYSFVFFIRKWLHPTSCFHHPPAKMYVNRCRQKKKPKLYI